MAKKRSQKSNAKARRRRNMYYAAIAIIGAAIAITAFFAFSGGGENSPSAPLRQEPVVTNEMDVTVDVVDNDFVADNLTVPRGAKVTWKFKGDEAHDVVDDRGAFESPTLKKGDEWSLTFDNPGTFYYYCTLHHAMQGTLIVAE